MEVSGEIMYEYNEEVLPSSQIVPKEVTVKLFSKPERFEEFNEYTALSNVIRKKLGMDLIEDEE